MTRLTKAQSDALLAIAAGEVTMRNRGHSEFRVPDSERYRTCECGASVDIGWAGWRWHPAKPAGGTP